MLATINALVTALNSIPAATAAATTALQNFATFSPQFNQARAIWAGRGIVEGDAFPLRVRVPAGVCHLTKDGDVLVDQMLAWDNELFRTDLGPLPEALQDRVRRALLDFLDLS